MKITAILGSPRSKSNSAFIVKKFLERAVKLGGEVTEFELNKLSYKGCQGCYACKTKLEECILQDDLTKVLKSVKEADVLLFASPVYFGDITAQLKGFIDRTFSFFKPDFLTNPPSTRLKLPKKLFFVITQGFPDPKMYADIFPRYERCFNLMGIEDVVLIRGCDLNADDPGLIPASVIQQAEDEAAKLFKA
ncbi:MAG: flavodoxin family protein [Desulfuromonadales bacterium]|nr:flavodoxin family protein [Desulfuromonadales bacterium]